MRISLVLAAAIIAAPTLARASNAGFKIDVELIQPAFGFGISGANWVSPPYLFFPDGDPDNPAQSPIDWCSQLNGGDPTASSPVQKIARFDTATDTFRNKFCGNPSEPFVLEPGVGYALHLHPGVPGPTVTVSLVGSHDDGYSANKGGTKTVTLVRAPVGASGSNWVSIPYHVKAENGEGLCTMLNGGDAGATRPVSSMAVFDTLTDTFYTKFCAGPVSVFSVVPGEAYAITLDASVSVEEGIQFDVY